MPDDDGTNAPTPPRHEDGGTTVEERPSNGTKRGLTRGQLVAGAAGAGLLIGGGIGAGATLATRDEADEAEPAAEPLEATRPGDESTPLMTFSAAEAATVGALVARLVPSDDNGPGAEEARVLRYIDRALTGDLGGSRNTYFAGLEALDAFAEDREGAAFVELTAEQQDRVVAALEANEAGGFAPAPAGDPAGVAASEVQPDSAAFFETVRAHTLQGMFGDPYHGGNVGFVGWDLLGFPGIELSVSAEQQQLGDVPAIEKRSTYDFEMFGAAKGKGA